MPAGMDASDVHRLARDLVRVPASTLPRVRAAVTKAATDVQAAAQAAAPVDTGNLRASIGTDVTDAGGVVAAEIGPTANYGAFVEFGTSRMAPHPYMGPALDANAARFEAAIDQIIDGAL